MEQTWGNKIKKARLKKNITQSQLAKYVGVCQNTISKYETNKISKPNFKHLHKIVEYLELKAETFYPDPKSLDQEEQLHWGERIKYAREYSGYTQLELANLVGVSEKTINLYENDIVKNPKLEHLKKIATRLQLDFNTLILQVSNF
ncbi:helix-turn-helix domain-containing protein [Cytobacillus kochii]|uniref:helix-turn-helix domain-containing protein n=1 Tax=Cytobacillus kochii TaxID=859143 RepID=UPI002784EA68|nr:helix-turn-helix transcriptional regulator [Cytobacillus kochii]MDQ0186302.1 transcriptional regulator with XRE-family HTH domain [Cytobacillus kochii]